MGLNEKRPGEEDEAMGMTMTQKILAAHAGLAEVKAGQLIEAELDLVLGNDITSPVAINEMKKMMKSMNKMGRGGKKGKFRLPF